MRPIVRSFAVFIAVLVAAGTAAFAASSPLWSERQSDGASFAELPDFSVLADRLNPAVVSIQVEQKVKVSRAPGRLGMPRGDGAPREDPFDFFHRFFGGEMPREFRNRGLGTGFFIQKEGLVVTNNHVVEDADTIEVTFEQAGATKTVGAKILGRAPEYDVALLQTDEKLDVPVVFLGDSDTTKIGEWVMAVGNPFGLSHSVSVGIISAKGRRDIAPSGRDGLYDFMQTDASINPGNSGGPLVNTRGEVIAVNTAINAAGAGIGFAIPINMVKAMLPELKEKGRFARSWIGVKIQPLTSELAESYGLKRDAGALVAEVVEGSPAAKAKLREGDVILGFAGHDVSSSTDLPLYASMAGVGKEVSVTIWRDGKRKSVALTLEEFPEASALAGSGTQSEDAGEDKLGMRVGELTPERRREFGIESDGGVVVTDVAQDSVAWRAGLRPGDLVLRLDGELVKSARDFAQKVSARKSGELLRIQVSRDGTRAFRALRKP